MEFFFLVAERPSIVERLRGWESVVHLTRIKPYPDHRRYRRMSQFLFCFDVTNAATLEKQTFFFTRRLHRDDENRFCVSSVFALTGCGVLVIIHVQHSEKSWIKKLGSARWSSSSQLSSEWTSKNCRVEGKKFVRWWQNISFLSPTQKLFFPNAWCDVPILVYLW